MYVILTARHILMLFLFTFVVFSIGYTMAINHSKGGKFTDWLKSFF